MSEKAKTTELAVKTPVSNYAIMQGDIDLNEIISANFGDDTINITDLDTIKVPSGGSKTWTVPTVNGEIEVQEIEGIIIHTMNTRVYYESDFTGEKVPPDCSSTDAKTGVGVPGGECSKCPMAEFGSAKNGKGQACNLNKQVFIIFEDSILPLIIRLPPTSLKVMKDYLLRLVSKKIPIYGTTTKFTLEKIQGKGTPDYSRLILTMGTLVADKERMKAYVEAIKPSLVPKNEEAPF